MPTAEVPIDPKRLADYAGEFRVGKAQVLGFTVRDGRLLAREAGKGYNGLTPTGPDRFAVTAIGAQFVFRRGEGGEVIGVTLTQGGSRLEGRRAGVAVPQD
ncbi:hypothetical protein D3C72_1170120 [compost metagenome]